MEIPDNVGGTIKPFSEAMLPSLLRAKIDHPSFTTWKALSEKDKDDWATAQVTFLPEAHKVLGSTMIALVNSEQPTKSQKRQKVYQKRKRKYLENFINFIFALECEISTCMVSPFFWQCCFLEFLPSEFFIFLYQY